MKSQLSHLMPVAKAIKILEIERVERIVQNLLSWQRQPSNQQTAISPSPLLANPTPWKPNTEDDAHHLVQAMLYSASSTSSSIPDSPHQQHLNSNVPPPIRLAWKRIFSRSLMLDKIAFLRFAVPASAQPHAGPGGHMGLFDCLFYALQQKAPSPVMGAGANPTSPNNALGASSAAGLPLISIPDLCIFLAICKAYMDLHDGTSYTSDETTTPPNGGLDPAIVQMSQWMFLVYDSYQKKNLISRDTLHRFLSDVHGEDSYKTPMIRDLLNVLFAASSAQTNREFVMSISATMRWEPRPSHVLLDWMGVLSQAILPPLAIPESTAQFLQTIEQEINWLPQVCSKFGLAENRFYEIKRRFHSLVGSASTVIHGDPMQEEGGADDSHAGAAADAQQPNNTNNASGRGGKQQPQLPKNAVSFRGFLNAVNPSYDEQGHGGYLPISVATKMFNFKKVKMAPTPPTKSPSSEGGSSGKKEGIPHFWDLTHVLQFGGMAVRADSDASLARWIAELYGTSFLSRREIGELLLGLIDHHLFRIEAELPPSQRDVRMTEEAKAANTNGKTDKEEVEISEYTTDKDIEQRMVDSNAALSLGLVPKKLDSPSKATSNGVGANKPDKGTPVKIALSALIDQVLKEVGSTTGTVSVTDLVAWHGKGEEASSTEAPATQRLGPLMLELRLIASVLFGIPPKSAAMEFGIVSEIQRRHRCRYPQTDVSRRGPRGTVWYIIDDLWYRTWNGLIQKVSKTPEDGEDLRDKPLSETTPRRLGCISNKGLLRENGSLALRVDIKWRHDYEIIPPLAWSALQAWYDGGPPIHRSVVPYVPPASSSSPHVRSTASRIRTENEIELYPFFVTIFMCDSASRGDARPFQQAVPVSRVTPLQVLTVQLCKGLDVDPKYGRLWMMESAGDGTMVSGSFSSGVMAGTSESSLPVPGQGDWLLDLSQNIVDQRKNRPGSDQSGNNITLLLELKDPETALWPRGVDGKQWTFRDKLDPNAPNMGDGIVGLYNMGNTCYLNSSIQCLSHTPIFRDYFTSKCYLNDINTTNPLGHQGRLAQVSAVLINSLWKRFNNQAPHQPKRVAAPGSYAPVNAPALTPKTFKESLGKFNEIFSGNEQHDAQELLAFLLGGLSEDLNRIVEKPYIEAPDSDGRPDSELADIWWSNHLKREMSIVVALFTGQYKSLLACRSCKYESARFEPFSFLQLPLPEDDHISVSLILYPIHEGAETMRYSVRVLNNGKLYDVLMALAKVLHMEEKTEAHTEDNGAEASPKLPDPIDDEERKKLYALYEERAQNMAVVDMRDGYIFKIAPNSWALPDLQNKETGELPLLHIYEMDPLPSDNQFHGCKSDFSDDATKYDATKETSVEEAPLTTDGDDNDDKEISKEPHSGNEESDSNKDNGMLNEAKLRDDDGDDNDEKVLSNEADTGGEDDSSDEGKVGGKERLKYSFLAISQRRTEQVSKDVLHPLVHRVFGTPLLLRAVGLESLSGRELYDLVAKRLRNFVPQTASSFLVDTSESLDRQITPIKGGELHCAEESTPPEAVRQRLQKTTTDMEEVSAGPVPRYGFRLRITSRDGRRCALLPWYECSIGCLVPDDDEPTVVMCGDSLVIDWHFAVDVATSGFGTRSNQSDQGSQQASPFRSRAPGVTVKNHSSCGYGAKQKGYAGAITLEDCLDAFAKEERIPEAYCSKCQDFRVQTKRMSLWRLPPVVIIQLKRFQFTQHMRRKLRDFVAFPVEGLDLSRIMAADTVGSKPAVETTSFGEGTGKEPAPMEDDKPFTNGETKGGNHGADDTSRTEDESTDTPMTTPDSGRSEMLYDLYGVVHHQGALSGGHYVASLKSDLDGRWRLFNDAQIYEIHSRDVVDSSAYILFYIRRDVMKSNLADFWETAPREGGCLTEEDMDKLIRGRSDRCVIS